jgi:restriction system protein
MPIPDYQTLMLPVLRLAASGETRALDLVEPIAKEFGLSADEREELLPSGRQRVLHNRIHWAKFYLFKAGLVEQTERGRFVATAAGRELLARNPSRIDNNVLRGYPSFVAFVDRDQPPESSPAHASPAADAEATPEEQIEAAHVALHAALRDDLLEHILQNSSAFFERLIVDLLVAMGYGGTHTAAAKQLGRSGDGGVDGVIDEDRLGLDRVYVQAKRYAARPRSAAPTFRGSSAASSASAPAKASL